MGFALPETSICCSSGFEYISSGDWNGYCGSYATTSTRLPIYDAQASEAIIDGTLVSTWSAVHLAYLVAWASSDLSKFTPASAPLLLASQEAILASSENLGTPKSGSPPTARSSAASPQGSPPSPASQTSSSHTEGARTLDTGVKAGIGVGVIVVSVAIISVGLWLLMRMRKRRKDKLASSTASEMDTDNIHAKAELDHENTRTGILNKGRQQEGREKEFAEMSGEGLVQEVGSHTRYELDSGWGGHEVGDIDKPTNH